MFITRVRLHPEELEKFAQDVQRAAQKFPDIVRIRHSFGEDWDGDPAIFFRVVLSDDAARDERLGEITALISKQMSDELELTTFERIPYFRFRSKAEEDKMKSPEWA